MRKVPFFQWALTLLLIILPALGFAGQYRCEKYLFDSIFDRVRARGSLSAPIDFIPTSRRVRLIFETNEYISPDENAQIEARQIEMANLGYIMMGQNYKNGQLELVFQRDSRLVTNTERGVKPEFLAQARDAFIERFPRARFSSRLYASKFERDYSTFPDDTLILTSKTINAITPMRYAFVRLAGENFLRLGGGHHLIGAKRVALAAGDIDLVRDPSSGQTLVTLVSPRSDTYRPPNESMLGALEALWSQGIYPHPIRLYDWNNKDLIFEYH